MDKRTVVIDACCVLNLLATRREVEIVQAVGMLLLDTELVSREPVVTWTAPDDDGVRHKEPASTEQLRSAGCLQTRALDTDALVDAFITCAARITDADASCIALAGVLKLPLLTDDRKERRVALEVFPGIELISTLDLLASSSALLGWDQMLLSRVATDLRWRGNFAPPRQDPRSAWYLSLLGAHK